MLVSQTSILLPFLLGMVSSLFLFPRFAGPATAFPAFSLFIGISMSQFALRWILMFDAVTCAIPGGKRPEQVADNCHASDLAPVTDEGMAAARRIYDQKISPLIGNRW